MTEAERKSLQTDMVTLREYMEALLYSQKEYFESKLGALAKATELQADVTKASFASVNEFRGAMNDSSARYATREEMYAKLEGQSAEINMLKESKAKLEGKASQTSVNIAYFISFVSIALTILKFVVK